MSPHLILFEGKGQYNAQAALCAWRARRETSSKIPNLNEIMKGKIEVKDEELFKINVEKRMAQVGDHEVFDRLIYTIE